MDMHRSCSGRNFFEEFKRSLNKIAPTIQQPRHFHHKTYAQLPPKNMLIYFDPPYKHTQSYSAGDYEHKVLEQDARMEQGQ